MKDYCNSQCSKNSSISDSEAEARQKYLMKCAELAQAQKSLDESKHTIEELRNQIRILQYELAYSRMKSDNLLKEVALLSGKVAAYREVLSKG